MDVTGWCGPGHDRGEATFDVAGGESTLDVAGRCDPLHDGDEATLDVADLGRCRIDATLDMAG